MPHVLQLGIVVLHKLKHRVVHKAMKNIHNAKRLLAHFLRPHLASVYVHERVLEDSLSLAKVECINSSRKKYVEILAVYSSSHTML